MWPAIASIAGAVLAAVGGLLKGSNRGGLQKRLREHLELVTIAKAVPAAEASLVALVTAEAEELSRREIGRLHRRLNRINLLLSILLAGASAAAVYLLVQWVTVAGDWRWFAVVVLVLVSLAGLLLSGAAFSTLYAKPAVSAGNKPRVSSGP